MGGCSRAGQGQGQALKRGHSPEGTSSLVAFGWLRQLPASPAMILPLPWLSRCCCRGLLPFWPPVLQGTWRCCSQGSKANREDASSDGLGKMSPSRVSGTKSEGVAQGAQIHTGGGGAGNRTVYKPAESRGTLPMELCPAPTLNSPSPSLPPPHSTPGALYLHPSLPAQSKKSLNRNFPHLTVNYFSGGLGQPVLPFPSHHIRRPVTAPGL